MNELIENPNSIYKQIKTIELNHKKNPSLDFTKRIIENLIKMLMYRDVLDDEKIFGEHSEKVRSDFSSWLDKQPELGSYDTLENEVFNKIIDYYSSIIQDNNNNMLDHAEIEIPATYKKGTDENHNIMVFLLINKSYSTKNLDNRISKVKSQETHHIIIIAPDNSKKNMQSFRKYYTEKTVDRNAFEIFEHIHFSNFLLRHCYLQNNYRWLTDSESEKIINSFSTGLSTICYDDPLISFLKNEVYGFPGQILSCISLGEKRYLRVSETSHLYFCDKNNY